MLCLLSIEGQHVYRTYTDTQTWQTYVFQGMMVNQFQHTTYSCSDGCHCMYATELESQCRIAGSGILQSYGYSANKRGEWIGILVGIIVAYRLMAWAALHLRRT